MTSGVRAEDDVSDHGSRAARKATRESLEASYHLGTFGGLYAQDGAFGLLVDAGVGGQLAMDKRRQRLKLELDYSHDPFTTKTFNFSDEEQSAEATRLVQAMHELDVGASWFGRHLPWLRSDVDLGGDAWLPELSMDRRFSTRAKASIRVGTLRGVYGQVGAGVYLKKYPNYRVSDRSIDQRGVTTKTELGYVFARGTSVGLGFELELKDYLDARYDALDADGLLVRATESKDYLNRTPYVEASVALHKKLRLGLSYKFEYNDSDYYTWQVLGRDTQGDSLPKLIGDYYDFARHWFSLKAKATPLRQLEANAFFETWFRDFETYEARDADNVWTGELRHDTSVELGAEVSLRVLRFRALKLDHGLFVSAFGSHVKRRSNMKREVSLATNFDVTRIFVGLEVRLL